MWLNNHASRADSATTTEEEISRVAVRWAKATRPTHPRPPINPASATSRVESLRILARDLPLAARCPRRRITPTQSAIVTGTGHERGRPHVLTLPYLSSPGAVKVPPSAAPAWNRRRVVEE